MVVADTTMCWRFLCSMSRWSRADTGHPKKRKHLLIELELNFTILDMPSKGTIRKLLLTAYGILVIIIRLHQMTTLFHGVKTCAVDTAVALPLHKLPEIKRPAVLPYRPRF